MTCEVYSKSYLNSQRESLLAAKSKIHLMKVLIIEDDVTTADFIAKGFREAGMIVDVCHEGNDGLDKLLIYSYDAAIVDVMLPGVDGLSIVQSLRSERNQTPILILSAKHTVSERIEGIRAGGDDYMVKPFSFSELLIRVQALIRRSQQTSRSEEQAYANKLSFADLELDLWRREARRGGVSIPLHQKEFILLEQLMKNSGRVISKTSIIENVYEYDFDPQTNVVDVLVHRLRSKVDKGYENKLIHTVRGMGYILKSEIEK